MNILHFADYFRRIKSIFNYDSKAYNQLIQSNRIR